MENNKQFAVIVASITIGLLLGALIVFNYLHVTSKQEPFKAVFLSKSKEVKPSMKKVLQMDNIRVYQYTDSLGTYTIFASEFDFLSNTANQSK